MAMRPDYDWLQYAWTQRGKDGSGSTAGSATEGGPAPVTAAARQVSWWLKHGIGEDPFDAEGFLRALARLSSEGRANTADASYGLGGGPEQEVLFAGDSTARQQTVSLCCLLKAGSVVANGAFRVVVTKALPYMDFKCRVYSRDRPKPLASVSFQRIMRADALPTWRPVERTPRLSPVLAAAINRAPTLLIINLGAWEYEDGCTDMHSTHDGLCNNTRPWILKEYASKWMLIAASLRSTYLHRGAGRTAGIAGSAAGGTGGGTVGGTVGGKAARSLVVWRAASPRDFEGGVAKQGGRCRRRQPYGRSDLSAVERQLNPSSMRFAVLTKNVIMDAVAQQAAPWVRVLDAYGIARQRADAHPGPDPKTNRRGSLERRAYDDCLHYCLPGVPDLYNGRLLKLLEDASATASSSAAATAAATAAADAPAFASPPPPSADSAEAAAAAAAPLVEGVPGTLLARWNFDLGSGRFVQGSPPRYALQLQRDSSPTLLECQLPAARGGDAAPGSTEPLAGPPLLGFCSDFDHAASFARRQSKAGGHGKASGGKASGGGAGKAAAKEPKSQRRANKAEGGDNSLLARLGRFAMGKDKKTTAAAPK